MNIIGIVCEYNPFHLGHKHQFDMIRRYYGDDSVIVCVMSGNYVQRGEPAIFDKSIRASAAVQCGADLVLELPVEGCLSSAEGFARSAVGILSEICDTLSFGIESMDPDLCYEIARHMEKPEFTRELKTALATGCSFPAARELALVNSGWKKSVPSLPNDILGLEYCRAILYYNSSLSVFPIRRENNYHSGRYQIFPSATAVRARILSNTPYMECVPDKAEQLYRTAEVHSLKTGEKAILYRLRTMDEKDFESVPFGSEGLWRRFMHASQKCGSIEELFASVKTKRYTYTRICRMVLCSYLGITSSQISSSAPYIRILAFNDKGRRILNQYKGCIPLINTGSKTKSDYEKLEYHYNSLYSLFTESEKQYSNESERRVMYL